jgi:hypothetical protein
MDSNALSIPKLDRTIVLFLFLFGQRKIDGPAGRQRMVTFSFHLVDINN